MPRPRWRPAQLLPPAGVPRTIAFQSALYAVGSGTFLTGSIVFFNRVLGLSPLQIGAGLSIAGLTGVLAALPLGGLTDRLGGRRAWVIGALVEGVAVAGYPLAGSFGEFIALMMVIALADALANSGRTVYTAEAIPAEGRVRTMAFARAYLNVGFTIGTGVGAAALALDSTAALDGMVLLNAAVLLLDALVVARFLPAVRQPAPAGPPVTAGRVCGTGRTWRCPGWWRCCCITRCCSPTSSRSGRSPIPIRRKRCWAGCSR